MRHASTLVVGSPTARMMAILGATLIIALGVAALAGAWAIAQDDAIVVDQAGEGDFETLAEAVEAASDGDTILVRPGTYTEAVIIDKDVTVSGDGPRDSVILAAPEGGPRSPHHVTGLRPYALWLDDVMATVAGLTLRGQASAVHVSGGEPTLTGLAFQGVGESHTIEMGRGAFADAVAIYAGAMATVADSTFIGGGPITSYEDTGVIVEGNTLIGGPSIIVFMPLEGSSIRDNAVSGSRFRAILVAGGPSRLPIEDNVVRKVDGDGIAVGIGEVEQGTDAIVRGNEISEAVTGISIAEGAGPTISDNTLTANDLGIWSTRGADHLLVADNRLTDNDVGIRVLGSLGAFEGNTVLGGETGIQVIWEAAPSISGNVVEGAGKVGLSIDASSSATVSDNHVCDNATNLDVEPESEVAIRATNEICEDAAAE